MRLERLKSEVLSSAIDPINAAVDKIETLIDLYNKSSENHLRSIKQIQKNNRIMFAAVFVLPVALLTIILIK